MATDAEAGLTEDREGEAAWRRRRHSEGGSGSGRLGGGGGGVALGTRGTAWHGQAGVHKSEAAARQWRHSSDERDGGTRGNGIGMGAAADPWAKVQQVQALAAQSSNTGRPI